MKMKSGLYIGALVLIAFSCLFLSARAATVLFPSGGGTGTSTAPTAGQVLVGKANGTYGPQATSTLGFTSAVTSVNGQTGTVVLTTTNVSEGTNQYFTNSRADARTISILVATTSLPNLTTLSGLTLPYSQLTGTPSLAAVATSGAYSDLTGKPTILTGSGTSGNCVQWGAANSLTDAGAACGSGTGGGGLATTTPWTTGQLVQVASAGSVKSIATSTLGLLTTDIAEGSNLYWTNGRFDARLTATTSLPNIATLASLSLPYSQLTGKPTIPTKTSDITNDSGFITNLSGFTTDNLTQGSTNKYWSNTLFDARLTATTTLPNITTLAGLSLPYTQLTGTPTILTGSGTNGHCVQWGSGNTLGDAGAACGTGTVTSVAATVPTGLLVSGSPITTNGTLAFTWNTGYAPMLTASSTNWETAYANRITSLTTTGTSGAATLSGNTLNIPQYANTTYTAGTGLTLTTGAFNVNSSQSISKLSNLTSNGFMKTSGSDGTLSIDTSTYLTANQTVTLSGDVSGSGSTAITTSIGSNKVTTGMLAQAGANTLLGNPTGSTANVQAISTSTLNIGGTAANVTGTVAIANGGTGITSVGASSTVATSNGTGIVWAAASGGGTIDYQDFTSSGTWTKPAGLSGSEIAIVQVWGGGGGGGGGSGNRGSGGGGGGYNTMTMPVSSLGSTVTVTIGVGGTGTSGSSVPTAGGNTTFGTLLTGYGGGHAGNNAGGGGGAGLLGVGVDGSASTAGAGGPPGGGLTGVASVGFGGGGGGNASTHFGGGAIYGGGGGGSADDTTSVGGTTIYGGGGGGGGVGGAVPNAGGASSQGGAGGRGGYSGGTNGADGTAPGGGGGGAGNSATGGSGAHGEVRVWVIKS